MSDRTVAEAARADMLDLLRREVSGDLDRLEDYHQFVADDAIHLDIQEKLTKLFWEQQYGPRIVGAQRDFFSRFVGIDLHAQRYPYLRMARPGKRQDNLGFHRDTQYGASAYELSVFVPFVDLPPEAAFLVLSGSHLEPESSYPSLSIPSETVVKGSTQHQLGYPYAPRVFQVEVRDRVESVPMEFGEMLIFSLSMVHGQEINAGSITRFSSDIRAVNSLAPIQWGRSVRPDYYVRLWESAVSLQARRFQEASGGTAQT
jgi:hypothetical protein